jgi:hypothetical protein
VDAADIQMIAYNSNRCGWKMKMKLSLPHLDDWIILLDKHINRRPLIKPGDIYKLLYQGILGPEHLVDSPSAFAKRLLGEFKALSPNLDDPFLEAIHPYKTLLRINLRPFKAAGLELDSLMDACLQTAARSWGAPEQLRSLWESVVSIYRQRLMAAFTPEEMDDFAVWLASHDYPAVHHTQAYRQAYQPAYRLVAADLAEPFTGAFNS